MATRESTQGRNPMGVMIAIKFLDKEKTLLYIRKFIQMESPVSVMSQKKNSVRLQIYILNKKSTLWKNSLGYRIPVSLR